MRRRPRPDLLPERARQLREFEGRLGHAFADLTLLDQALTHTSHAHETLGLAAAHNEPLEFLGDSVLGFLVAETLHHRDPDGPEGAKSKARARLVSAPSLARHAEALGLPELLRLGPGEERSGGRKKAAIWADAYEAVIAALYLDGGLEAARAFVTSAFAADLEDLGDVSAHDPKSALQELRQSRGLAVPEYVVSSEEGPSHRPRFRVSCLLDGRVVSEGEGFSKKEAQQEAARLALAALRVRPGDLPGIT